MYVQTNKYRLFLYRIVKTITYSHMGTYCIWVDDKYKVVADYLRNYHRERKTQFGNSQHHLSV